MNPKYNFTVTKIYGLIERYAPSDWCIKNVSNGSTFRITLVLNGSGQFEFNGKVYPMKKDELFWFPQKISRSGKANPDDPWHFIGVHFNLEIFGDYGDRSYNDFSELTQKPMYCPQNIRKKFIDLSAVWQEKGLAYQPKCRAMLQDILADLIIYNNKIHHNPLHYQNIEMIQNHIQENISKQFDVKDLAAMADVSVSYFRQLFKSISGMSVAQYINYIKINKAKDLLISGEYNVTEVATQTGYSDIFYFSRIFKHYTGHPPSYYLH